MCYICNFQSWQLACIWSEMYMQQQIPSYLVLTKLKNTSLETWLKQELQCNVFKGFVFLKQTLIYKLVFGMDQAYYNLFWYTHILRIEGKLNT